ncbi:hypothetical protein BaRGS_00016763 [Batillaria attramentaria]|uniref:Uncharacterized protein n=1 Tax=Batillaria attramentaria TaxID=370345 RepID=A0ABD0KXS2_9CAEN
MRTALRHVPRWWKRDAVLARVGRWPVGGGSVVRRGSARHRPLDMPVPKDSSLKFCVAKAHVQTVPSVTPLTLPFTFYSCGTEWTDQRYPSPEAAQRISVVDVVCMYRQSQPAK